MRRSIWAVPGHWSECPTTRWPQDWRSRDTRPSSAPSVARASSCLVSPWTVTTTSHRHHHHHCSIHSCSLPLCDQPRCFLLCLQQPITMYFFVLNVEFIYIQLTKNVYDDAAANTWLVRKWNNVDISSLFHWEWILASRRTFYLSLCLVSAVSVLYVGTGT